MSVTQICALIKTRESAVRAHTLVANRNQWFVWQKQTRHSNVADLRVLKLNLAFAAYQNPFGHIHIPRCDSQKAGEHGAESEVIKIQFWKSIGCVL